jgi:hypothetical protein
MPARKSAPRARKRPTKKAARKRAPAARKKKAASRKRPAVSRGPNEGKGNQASAGPRNSRRRFATSESRVVTEIGEVDFSERVVTNSARGTFQDCRQKFLLEYGHRLAPRGVVDYFWVGGVVHDQYQKMYEAGSFDRAAAKKELDGLTREAVAKCTSPDQEAKVWKASATAQGILPVYADNYLAGDLRRFEILECEGKFEYPIPRTSWRYAGMRDMIVRVKEDGGGYKRGEVGLVEHKTTGELDVNYVAKLPLDYQILGYCWSWKQQSGRLPDFVLYNVALKTRLRQKKVETFGQYLDRVEADYREDPSKYFYRERLEFDKAAVWSFERELRKFVEHDLEASIRSGYFSKNTRQCTIRGLCTFMALCEGSVPSEEAVLMYRRKKSAHEELE